MFNRQISIKLSIHKLITIFLQREISIARNTYAITIIYFLLTLKPTLRHGEGNFNFLYPITLKPNSMQYDCLKYFRIFINWFGKTYYYSGKIFKNMADGQIEHLPFMSKVKDMN